MSEYSASTLERLAFELEVADREMTPGPWGVLPEQFDPWHVNAPSRDVCALPCDHRPDERAADAHSICNLRNSAPEIAAALRAAVERVRELERENGAHRALSMLEPKEMSYADRSEFERLKRADVEQGKRIAEMTARLATLDSLVDRAADLAIAALSTQYVGEKVRIREEVASIRAAREAK